MNWQMGTEGEYKISRGFLGQAKSGANHFRHVGQNSVLWPHLIVGRVVSVVCLCAQEKKEMDFGKHRAVSFSCKIQGNMYTHSHALLCL